MADETLSVSPAKTKAEAKALGLHKYFTGRPCKRGHLESSGSVQNGEGSMPTIHVIYDPSDRIQMPPKDKLPRGIEAVLLLVGDRLTPEEAKTTTAKLLDLLMERLTVCPETPAHVEESSAG